LTFPVRIDLRRLLNHYRFAHLTPPKVLLPF
jgi:hypothetical protein